MMGKPATIGHPWQAAGAGLGDGCGGAARARRAADQRRVAGVGGGARLLRHGLAALAQLRPQPGARGGPGPRDEAARQEEDQPRRAAHHEVRQQATL